MASLVWPRSLRHTNRLIRNVSANMIGGAWNGLLIVLATPWYVRLLSLEGYGLLGFWLLMQLVLSVSDLGLGAALLREFADSHERQSANGRRRELLRTLEYVYWPIAAVLTIALLLASHWIATDWLKVHAFTNLQVANAISWMALALGLQYPCALYSSGLAGLQSQARLNALQMAGNGLRYGGGVAILLWRTDPVWFFSVQAVIAAVQTLATRAVLWHMIRTADSQPPVFRLEALKSLWRFSAGMAFTMMVSVALANADRLFISKFLPAEELGKYTLALTATGLLQMGIQPFYRAYFPRFAELIAMGDSDSLRKEYYFGCRLVAGVILPVALIGWAFAPELFLTWIGRTDRTTVAAFRWLLLGIASSGLMWLPAAFQQAHGWTRLHAAMITGALSLGFPSLWWTTKYWGTSGATAIWVLHGVSDVTLGLWLMHKRLLPGEFITWYRTVLVPPLLIGLPTVGLSWWFMPPGLSRWSGAVWVGSTGVIVVLGTLVFVTRGIFSTRGVLVSNPS